jgi:hypothetical protein
MRAVAMTFWNLRRTQPLLVIIGYKSSIGIDLSTRK